MEETFSKKNLLKPIEGEFRAILTHREKTKGGKPRYYLYTQDEKQKLIIAAQHYPRYDVTFRISSSGNEFDKESDFYLGKIVHLENFPDYKIYTVEKGQDKVEVAETLFYRKFERKTRERKFDIKLIGKEDLNIEMLPFEEFHTDNPTIEVKESLQNFYFKLNGKPCFTLYCTEEDEYQLVATAPFSIYTAFTIAVTTMILIRYE